MKVYQLIEYLERCGLSCQPVWSDDRPHPAHLDAEVVRVIDIVRSNASRQHSELQLVTDIGPARVAVEHMVRRNETCLAYRVAREIADSGAPGVPKMYRWAWYGHYMPVPATILRAVVLRVLSMIYEPDASQPG